MEGAVINQICASMDSFFDTEKKIGDYIVRNPKKVVDMTVGELAKESARPRCRDSANE